MSTQTHLLNRAAAATASRAVRASATGRPAACAVHCGHYFYQKVPWLSVSARLIFL